MASANRPPSDPPGGRRKRPPAVINLEATEVPPENPAFATAPAPPADTTPPAAETPVPPSSAKPQDMPQNTPQDMPQDTPRDTSQGTLEDKPRENPQETPEAKPEEARFGKSAFEPPPPREPGPARAAMDRQPEPVVPPPGLPGSSWSPIVAAAFGAAGGFLLFLVLWLGGVFSAGTPVIPAQPDPGPRLAAIEKELGAMAARPVPAGVDPRAVDEISARLARLEAAVAAPRAPVTDAVVLSRIGATENASKSLADNVAGLSRRLDALEAALRDAGAKIDDRLGRLAAATAEMQARARETAAGSDRAARLAVAAAALRSTVERGDAYAAGLAVVRPLATDSAALAALEPFAATGVPSPNALGIELAAIVRPMLRAAGEVPRDGGILERIQANAEKLVRIRPVDEATGDDRTAMLSRIEARAAAGNIAGALTELARLSADARAPKQAELAAWIERAQARTKALDAARRLAADAVAALKVTP